jgi:uncharacterized membrane protein
MIWILPAIGAALINAANSAIAKKQTTKLEPLATNWSWYFYSLIIVLPLTFLNGLPHIDLTFWLALLLRTILDAFAAILYIQSIKRSDLSLVLPLLALTPLFLLFAGWLVNGDLPTTFGFIGVALVATGAYFLYRKPKQGVAGAILMIGKDYGARRMLLVAIIWSLTSSLHKVAITHSNPYFYAGISSLFLSIVFTLILFYQYRNNTFSIIKKTYDFGAFSIGLFVGAEFFFQMMAQSLTLAVYVIAVKRLSIVIASFLGKIFFNEPLQNRLMPIICMVLGAILISIA